MRRVALTIGCKTNAAPYRDALERCLAVEHVLPGDARVATDFDGIVLAGGSDINPALYGDAAIADTGEADDARDAMEQRLITEALAAGMPIFAVCRGVQMLNVATGGKLIQHLRTSEVHRQKGVLDAHEVAVRPGTRLAGITGSGRLMVNSRHHQALEPRHLGKGLTITAARPDDGVIEAVEMPGRAFVLGVQWHPEDCVDVRESDRELFAAFADAVNG